MNTLRIWVWLVTVVCKFGPVMCEQVNSEEKKDYKRPPPWFLYWRHCLLVHIHDCDTQSRSALNKLPNSCQKSRRNRKVFVWNLRWNWLEDPITSTNTWMGTVVHTQVSSPHRPLMQSCYASPSLPVGDKGIISTGWVMDSVFVGLLRYININFLSQRYSIRGHFQISYDMHMSQHGGPEDMVFNVLILSVLSGQTRERSETRAFAINYYRQVSIIRRTKYQHLKDFRTVLWLSLPNPLKPDVKSRMKM